MHRVAIFVNGLEKYASGITKDTTVDDVKFAMLSSSVPDFTPDKLNDYGVFEQCDSHEKLLDGRVKMYKILKKLNNQQVDQLRFFIKQKLQKKKTQNLIDCEQDKSSFKLCSLSPTIRKTWNQQKALSTKSSFVKKQLKQLTSQTEPINDRFASIRQLNKSKKSTIVKTNFKLENQLEKITELKYKMKTMQNKIKDNLCKQKCEIFDENDDDTFCLKKKFLESLESELKKLDKQTIEKKFNSSSSIVSVDSGLSSCYGSSDDEDDLFYKLSTFETLV